MKLLLDIGNTRIKWAFESQGKLSASGEFVHRGKADDELTEFLDELEGVPNRSAAVNVAGDATGSRIAAAVVQRFGCSLSFVRTGAAFEALRNGYVATEQLGADRWAALVGAWKKYSAAVCVVDAGSATTIDLVASDGQHFGGIILPGLSLMHSTLMSDTSDIAAFVKGAQSLPDTKEWYGRDTASAVGRGSLFATIRTIEAAVMDFPEPTVEPRLILTGGDAPLLLDHLPASVKHHPLLVLEGLGLLSREP